MYISNKDEEKSKKRRQELDKFEREIDERDNELVQKEMDIEKREQKLVQKELDAKKGFLKQQTEAHNETIESLNNFFEDRKKELESSQQAFEQKFKDIAKREAKIALRERSLKEREILADAGFADKNRTALCELEKRENECKEFEKRVKERENELSAEFREQEKKAEKLRKREKTLQDAKIEREHGYTKERKKLDEEMAQKRCESEEEISRLRAQRIEELEEQLEAERRQRLAGLKKLQEQERNQTRREIEKWKSNFQQEKEKIEQSLKDEKRCLDDLSVKLKASEEDLEYNEKRLASKEDKFEQRQENWEEEVEQKTIERRKSFEKREKQLKEECKRLRDSLTRADSNIGLYEELTRRLGGEAPEEVLKRLNSQEEELKKLREELLERPTAEMLSTFNRTNEENTRLKNMVEELREKTTELQESLAGENVLRGEISIVKTKNEALSNKNESMEREYNRIQIELKRMQASYEREQDREARIRDIESPYFKAQGVQDKANIEEIAWLNRIDKSCRKYGLRFPKRILYAFHTALKTAEWSPLTVLAGVSGTGKSELPRLYSHFGGLNFLSLAVQPNWDSQESMLGFFNSIDNKFDAQPVLRLLAQSQKKADKDYPGMKGFMNLILLDEMNLAHIELYFSDFLSKLELRRGRKIKDVPTLDVKLGAGVDPYSLPLGRNVLWAGTMNQDETTKSLSDKVLDRGTIIHFPRPTKFERRKELKDIGKTMPLLPRKTWESWWARKSQFSEEQILPFKSFIEEMNQSLAKVGRALGHRVWQSVEYYMTNYPEVRAAKDQNTLEKAMKKAFEDQLVQKVMPKLRGIDTRGKSKNECLDKIRAQLQEKDYVIVEDFDLACEFGYGQFMWNSANYLKDEIDDNGDEEGSDEKREEENNDEKKEEKSEKIVVEKTEEKPLPLPDKNNLTPKQRRMLKEKARRKKK